MNMYGKLHILNSIVHKAEKAKYAKCIREHLCQHYEEYNNQKK